MALTQIRIGVLVIYVLSLVRLVFFFLQMLSDPVSLRRFNKKDCIDTSIGWYVVRYLGLSASSLSPSF